MLRAEWINVTFFLTLAGAAFLRSLPPGRKRNIFALAALGLGLVLLGRSSELVLSSGWSKIVRDWLPAPLVLVAYWQAGQFFQKPWIELQEALDGIDSRLGAALKPLRPLGESALLGTYLEIAYLFAYPVVPLALAVLYATGFSDHADSFWASVLLPSYICYGALLFLPTLPPRLLSREGADLLLKTRPDRHRVLNVWLLDRMGIGANTFPSGHVAATTGAALSVFDASPAAGAVFLWMALSIALSVVVRRYHYFSDAVLAVALALATWFVK